MFNLFRKKKTKVISCVEGVLIPLKDVKDNLFSTGAIGRGVAVKPTSNTIISPVNGTISMIFPTKHAFGLTTEDGLEFMLHIGIDTVKLKGEGFHIIAKEGQMVKKGDVLAEVDFHFLAKEGFITDTLILLTSDESKAEYKETCEYGNLVGGMDQTIFECNSK